MEFVTVQLQLREIWCYVFLLLERMLGKAGIISSYHTSHFKNKNTYRKI